MCQSSSGSEAQEDFHAYLDINLSAPLEDARPQLESALEEALQMMEAIDPSEAASYREPLQDDALIEGTQEELEPRLAELHAELDEGDLNKIETYDEGKPERKPHQTDSDWEFELRMFEYAMACWRNQVWTIRKALLLHDVLYGQAETGSGAASGGNGGEELGGNGGQ